MKSMVGDREWESLKILPEGIWQTEKGEIGFSITPEQLVLLNPLGIDLNVILRGLPTSDMYLYSGAVWRDGDTLKIVP